MLHKNEQTVAKIIEIVAKAKMTKTNCTISKTVKTCKPDASQKSYQNR